MSLDQIPPGTDLNLVPIADPPYPGYVRNLTGKGELEDATIAICTVVIVLQLIFLGIRVFTKLRAKLRLAYDDWCALVAAVLCFSLCFCIIFNRAQGRHMWDFSIGMALDARRAKVLYASLLLLGPAVFMGKITLLALYLKIFGHMTKVRWSIYAVSVFALTILVMTPLDATKCGNIPGQGWGLQNPACSETFLYGIVQGVVSLVIDLYILILPIPIIARLNMERKKRIGVLIIFLTGTIAIIADGIVMKYRIDLYAAKDISWAGFLINLCSVVETGISVVVSSMPTLAKFGRQHLFQWGYFITLRSYFSNSRKSSSTPSGSTGYSNAKPKKRPDPYSIGMPTDNSVTQLYSNAYIELEDHGHLAPTNEKNIKRTVSVDQTSMTYVERSADRLV